MGRVCAVPGCQSGSSKDLKERETNQIRKCSTFTVPKDSQLRKIWSDTLGTELNDKSAICELHFKKEDLYMDDDVVNLPNGDVFISYRKRITLKKNARPLTNVVQTNEISEQENEHFPKKIKNYSKEKLKPSDLSGDEVPFFNTTLLPKFDTFDINQNDEEDNRMEVEYNFDNNISAKECTFPSQSSTADTVFSILKLVEILKNSHLRQNWSWAEKDGDIFLSFFDLNELTIRCYLQVHSNMKVTIFLCDKQKLVNFTGVTEIKSLEDMKEILQRLEDQKLCMGTGLSYNSRSETCAIANTPGRCSFCLKQKTKLEKDKLSIEDKYHDLVKRFELMKKKADYRSKKLDEARKQIEKLENEIENSEAIFRKRMLERLPDIQKEIVSMFIRNVDLEKNRIRYDSREWMSECLVMYKKNRALYLYMRERGILPLPCPITINTQQKILGSEEH